MGNAGMTSARLIGIRFRSEENRFEPMRQQE